MYECYWGKDKKQPHSKSIEAFGYVHKLISEDVPDPVDYYKEYVKKREEERLAQSAEETRPRAFVGPTEISAGHFLIHSLLSELDVKGTIDILSSQMRFQFSI